jgi:Flp pilus assembly protein TadG
VSVELAVCVIPLMMLIMGIIECGRLMSVEEIAANATREGARLSALSGSTMGTSTSTGPYEVNYRVLSYLTAAGIPTGSATVTVSDLDNPTITELTQASVGDRIQVSLSMPYSSVALFTPWFFGGATVSATSVMRKESP